MVYEPTQPSVVLEVAMLHLEKLLLALRGVVDVDEEGQFEDMCRLYVDRVEAVLMIGVTSWEPGGSDKSMCCVENFFTPYEK